MHRRTYVLIGLLGGAVALASSADRLPGIIHPGLTRLDTERIDAVTFRKARAGDAHSQYLVGLYYQNGTFGWETNEASAIEWFRKSAENGYAPAQFEIGEHLEDIAMGIEEQYKWHGESVTQEKATQLAAQAKQISSESLDWLRKSADQGLTKAQYTLAMRLGRAAVQSQFTLSEQMTDPAGINIQSIYVVWEPPRPPDRSLELESLEWLRKVAEKAVNGDAEAKAIEPWPCEQLATYYLRNNLYVEAAKWLRIGVEAGHWSYAIDLAEMYCDGNGVPKDQVEALKWGHRAAATEGLDPKAVGYYMVRLGQLFACKLGPHLQDCVEAYKWFNIATASSVGHWSALAREERDRLASQMTSEQIAEGQRRSTEYLAHYQKRHDAGAESKAADSLLGVETSGSGFFVTDDGYMCTSYHILQSGSKIVVRTRNGNYPAKILSRDAANDLAILKMEGKFSAIPVSASRTVQLGEPALTIGFPNVEIQGSTPKLTRGEVSSLAGIQDDPRYFQISVPVQPGNSGGPLVDSRGNVVGIVAMRMDDAKAYKVTGTLPQNVNYAVKSSLLLSLVESVPGLQAKLKPPHAAKDRKSEDVVKEAQAATALVLVCRRVGVVR